MQSFVGIVIQVYFIRWDIFRLLHVGVPVVFSSLKGAPKSILDCKSYQRYRGADNSPNRGILSTSKLLLESTARFGDGIEARSPFQAFSNGGLDRRRGGCQTVAGRIERKRFGAVQ